MKVLKKHEHEKTKFVFRHGYEFVSTGNGFWTANRDGSSRTQIITQAGAIIGDIQASAKSIDTAEIADSAIETLQINASAVTNAKIETSLIQFAKVTLTSTNIKALAATPIQLVAAPGANKIIIVHRVFLHHDFDTGAYVEPSAPDDMVIQYGDGLDITGAIDATGFLTATADTWISALPIAIAASAAATIGFNKKVEILNTGGEYTTGAGTLDVYISYSVADFS